MNKTVKIILEIYGKYILRYTKGHVFNMECIHIYQCFAPLLQS